MTINTKTARQVAVALVCSALPVLVAACGNTAAPAAIPVPAAGIEITPAQGALNVHPDAPVRVEALNGHVLAVSVTAGSQDVAGLRDWEATDWTSQWALHPGTTYTIRATVANLAGKTVTETTKFRTLRAAETFSTSLDWTLAANQGEDYGVGLPIILNFSRPVQDKEAVQNALVVQAQKPVPGAWRWITDEQAVYRTQTFWPAHQTVTLQAHLAGVEA